MRNEQGRRKHLKLGEGARCFEGTFPLRNKGHFLKIKRALLCLSQNLVGSSTCFQCPLPGSYVYGNKLLVLNLILGQVLTSTCFCTFFQFHNLSKFIEYHCLNQDGLSTIPLDLDWISVLDFCCSEILTKETIGNDATWLYEA